MQAHIFYSGMVQGVGFRDTVRRHARALGLAGWVRNLPDGRVEILVEGSREDIGRLCHCVEEHFPGFIKDKTVSFQEGEEVFEDFSIIH